ncbi:MAG: DUF2442 domain-containing protein [Prevotella sp.]|jgi:hypothetical protein|nr:DUF2442 domain-containing protein [Prevotella sp.]
MKKNLKKSITDLSVIAINSLGVDIFCNGEKLLISYDFCPYFKDAKVKDIFDVRLIGGDVLCWDNLDIHILIDSIKHPEKYPIHIPPHSFGF